MFVHVHAQDFDEQHFGQFRQHARPTRARRTRFGQRIAHRGLQPDAGVGTAHVDPHHRRQARQQHLRQARVAGQVAANQTRGGAAASVHQRARAAGQHRIQASARGGRQTRLGSHAVRIALREQHHVAGDEFQRRLTVDFDEAFAFGDQVEDHHAFCAGLQQRRCGACAGRLVAPGRGELALDENRADQVHYAQGFGKRVHAQPASMRSCSGVAVRTAAGTGEQRRLRSTIRRKAAGDTPAARSLTCRLMSREPA